MPLIGEEEMSAGTAGLLSRRSRPVPGPGTLPPQLRRELRPLSAVLAARRSVREFSGEPLALADLEFIVGHAEQAVRAWWPAGPRPDLGLTVLAAAFDVAGLPRGIHAIVSGSGPRILGEPRALRANTSSACTSLVSAAGCQGVPATGYRAASGCAVAVSRSPGSRSASRARTRASISSRMRLTVAASLPAGSSTSQSR